MRSAEELSKAIEPTISDSHFSISASLKNIDLHGSFNYEKRLFEDASSSNQQSLSLTIIDRPIESLFLTPKTAYAGPKTPNLDGLNKSAVDRFVNADKVFYSATGQYLQIESGRRAIQRQAELYICWRLGDAGCNPADIPGASVHNYGFAIDIRSASDNAVVAALSQNGWERTVMPKEPWHWEATSAEGYDKAKQFQSEMKAPGSLSRKWQDQWEAARTKNDLRNNKIDNYNARVRVWQPEWNRLIADVDQLKKDIDSFNVRGAVWNRDRDNFVQWVNQHNQRVRELQDFRERVEAMPNGSAKNEAIREYNRRASELQNERARIDQAESELLSRSQSLEKEKSQLQARDAELQKRYSGLNAESESLVSLKKEIEQLDADIDKHISAAKDLLKQIEAAVGPL